MAEKKMTTVEQLKMLALRAKADSVARIADLAALVVAGYGQLITVTLPAAEWSGKAQTIEHESFLANSGYCYFAYGGIGVNAADITLNGQVIFQCDNVPAADLTVDMIRIEVDTETNSVNVGKVFNLASNESLKTYIDKRFDDFHDALVNELLVYFGLCDSDSKVILDNNAKGVAAFEIE